MKENERKIYLQQVGEAIRRRRILKFGSRSKTEFCDLLDISRPHLDSIEESGVMRTDQLMEICEALMCSPHRLFK